MPDAFAFGWLACFQRLAFHFHIDLDIAVSGIDVGVSEPALHDTDIIWVWLFWNRENRPFSQ